MLPKWMRKTWCLDKWFSFNSALDRWKDWLHKTVRLWQAEYLPTCNWPKWMWKMWMWTSRTWSGLRLLRSCRLYASVSSAEWMQQKEAKVMQIWVGPNNGMFYTLAWSLVSITLFFRLQVDSRNCEICKCQKMQECPSLDYCSEKKSESTQIIWPFMTSESECLTPNDLVF